MRPARRDTDSGFWFHGEWIPDPYEWLEDLDDPEARVWVEEQEAATHHILDAVPGRDRLRAEVTRASRYERLSRPVRAGGHEFVWQAGPDDDKLALRMRREPDGRLETVIDPNTWPSTETLVYAVPSPDGRLVAFGTAVGSTHDADPDSRHRQLAGPGRPATRDQPHGLRMAARLRPLLRRDR